MIAEKIYDDDFIEIFYLDNHSENIIVTFNNLKTLANGKNFWGETVCKKLNYSAIGIMSKNTDWFPKISTKALENINILMSKYKKRIGYAYSMGAYGAIKYSNALQLTHTIAISPQYSIDPKLVGKIDNRYLQYYKKLNTEHKYEIKRVDLHGLIYIIYDDKFEKDEYHARAIQKLNQNLIKLIPQSYTSHDVIQTIKGADSFERIISFVINGNILELIRYLNEIKKNRWEYYYYLGFKCMDRGKYLSAENLFLSSLDKNGDTEKNNIALSQIFQKRGDEKKAYFYATRAIVGGCSDKPFANLAEIYKDFGKIEESVRAYYIAWIQSRHFMYLRHIVMTYEQSGLYKQALQFIKDFEKELQNHNFYNVLRGRISFSVGDFNNAVIYMRKAYQQEPENLYFAELYIKVLIQTNEIHEATQLLDSLTNNKLKIRNMDNYISIIKSKGVQ